MTALLQSLRLVFLLSAFLAQQAHASSEDISYLSYDVAAQSSRTCLSNAIAFADRSNITIGANQYPVHVWSFWWPLGLVMAELIKILMQEVMGFHAVWMGNTPQGSISAWTALMDCYNPGTIGLPCRPQAPGSRAHLAFEVWANYDVTMINWAITEGVEDRTPIRVGYPGGMGFDGIEGLFVGSASFAQAASPAGNYLFLKWYESYNDSWSSPQPYFTDYMNVSSTGRQACVDMGAFSVAAGLQTYMDVTGDIVPTEMINGIEVGVCYNNWMPSRACRDRNGVGCIPIVTCALSVPDIMQWQYWFNFASALGSYTWGAYVSVTRDSRIIVLWWLPDNTFANDGYEQIQFPTVDSDAIAQGIIRTQKSATKIWKMMSTLIPQAEPLIESFMNNMEISMGSMMAMAAGYDGSDAWQAACDFLTNYPERWGFWIPDRTACIEGQGLTTDASGIQVCQWCPDGTYSAPHPTISTSRICADCALGKYQASPGQTECSSCLPGSAAGVVGQSACEMCNLGLYANQTGMSACSSCGYQKATPAYWTTMRALSTGSGTRVSYITGATGFSDCTCDVNTRYQGSECVACIEELNCEGMGNVQVLPGFAALNGDVNKVFKCYLDERWCPGGAAGVCAEGREGPLCGACKPDHSPGEGGKCAKCAGSDTLPFIIVLLIVFVILCLGYHNVARAQIGKGKSALSVMLMVTTCGQIIAFTQMTGTFGSLEAEWGEPFNTVLAIAKVVTSFNLDFIKLGCVAQLTPLATYISRVSIIFIGIGCILFIFVVHTIVLMKGDFKRMGKKVIVCLGALGTSLYISVVVTVTAPLQCVEHPSGDYTVRSYPTVLCAGGGDYTSMVTIAIIVALFPVGLLAIVAWCNLQFASRMKQMDTGFFEVAGFLFVCYRVETYWYCIATWIRNLIVALVPIIPNIVAQITVFNMLLLSMLVLASRYLPWRAKAANFLDISLYCGIVCVNGLAIAFATPDTKLIAYIAMTFILICLAAILFAGLYGLSKVLMGARKQYEYFVSHHKAVTGAFARLLKMMILEARKDICVFLDSDNLVNLDVLFDTVANDVEHIVMVTNAEFMKRPWCMGELAIAQIKRVKVWPLYYADFTPPDEDFIMNYKNHVPDMTTLTEQNITLESVQAGMRWFNELPYIQLPDKMSNADLDQLLQNVLTTNMQPLSSASVKSSKSKARKDAKILIAVDQTLFQAAMAARVLCKLLGYYAKSEADSMSMQNNLPEMLADTCEDGKPPVLTTSTSMLVVVLSNGCLSNPDMIAILYQATQTKPILMPVVAGDGFRFPSPEFYEKLFLDVNSALGGTAAESEMVISGIFMMFKRIAPMFEPNGSTMLLNAQSGEVYNKMKLLVNASSENDWDAWKSDGKGGGGGGRLSGSDIVMLV